MINQINNLTSPPAGEVAFEKGGGGSLTNCNNLNNPSPNITYSALPQGEGLNLFNNLIKE